jgi:CAAX prenyl protease-like protein
MPSYANDSLKPERSDGCGHSEPLPRVFPFATYLGFIALYEGLRWLTGVFPSLANWSGDIVLWMYPVKGVTVLGCLLYFWPRYKELKGRAFGGGWEVAFSLAVGVFVYLAWVRMDWPWAQLGVSDGYDPFRAGRVAGAILAGTRLLGAAVIVPIMEELFWRSFVIRYMISPDFESIPLGTFTVTSFFATAILFGAEHRLWLAGLMAGLVYNLLWCRTGRLWPCILAHGATNLALGIHVLLTGEWGWW